MHTPSRCGYTYSFARFQSASLVLTALKKLSRVSQLR